MTHSQLLRRVLKPAVFVAGCAPGVWLVARTVRGDWTLRLLVATIAITPIRWLTKWNPIITFRRMIGLFAFFYGTTHFCIYFLFDRSLQFDGLWEDIALRPYITVGFTAFVLMIPLAITSTTGWIRRLGGRRWNLLHRLVYVSAICGALHYWWKVKLDVTNPVIYAAIVGVLLGWRVVKAVNKRESRSRTARASALSEG
jgi:sulfoxide reductase heme-binding subunit YedZ